MQTNVSADEQEAFFARGNRAASGALWRMVQEKMKSPQGYDNASLKKEVCKRRKSTQLHSQIIP
jgi:hypothetical protein